VKPMVLVIMMAAFLTNLSAQSVTAQAALTTQTAGACLSGNGQCNSTLLVLSNPSPLTDFSLVSNCMAGSSECNHLLSSPTNPQGASVAGGLVSPEVSGPISACDDGPLCKSASSLTNTQSSGVSINPR
jgi:hypothetical protein